MNGKDADQVADYANLPLQTVSLDFDSFSTSSNVIVNGFVSSVSLTKIITSVPETSTWAMMVLGFGFIGWAMRRQRQTTRVQFAM